MLFNSFEFILFLPLVLLGHHLLSGNPLRVFLLGASYVFYGWHEPKWCALLLFTTLLDWKAALQIGASDDARVRRFWLGVSLAGNLGLLAYFKYAPWVVNSLRLPIFSLFGVHLDKMGQLELPPGISFYTFQTLSYTVDVYRRQLEPVKSLRDLALYVSYFPQLVAGPIERVKDLLPQVLEKAARTPQDLQDGFTRVLWGLTKKTVFADNFSGFVSAVWGNAQAATTWELFLALHTFSFQVYLDFSAYSDIACGTAQMMGVRLKENFRWPFLARNPIEFWQRWHVTLGTWIRDYVYFPLGGSRDGKVYGYFNSLICMLAVGLWHGADAKFLIWGFFHWIYEMVYRAWVAIFGSHFKPGMAYSLGDIPAIFVMYNLVIPQVFFGAPTLADGWYILSRLFTDWSAPALSQTPEYVLRITLLLAVAMGFHMVRGVSGGRTPNFAQLGTVSRGLLWGGMVLGMVFFHATQPQHFFYFQF